MVSSPASPYPGQPAAPSPLRVRDAGGLVAALPVMLGFHPRESLVLVATGGESGRRLGLTLRVDLPPPEHVEAMCATAAQTLLAASPAGAAVVVLSANAPGAAFGPPLARLAAAAVVALRERGVPTHTTVWAESTLGGSRWACYDGCGCGGRLPDAASTELAAAATVAGQVVYADREDLEEMVAAADPADLERRDRLLSDAPRLEGTAAGRALLGSVLAEAATGLLALDDEKVVGVAVALTDPMVRDMAQAACAGPDAAAAEHLWVALTRETPEPEAAEPAALLAVSALLRGDGALANVALDRAERAWPGHRFTATLRVAAEMAMSPDRLRECLWEGGAPAVGADRP